jgi:hypothetical protein
MPQGRQAPLHGSRRQMECNGDLTVGATLPEQLDEFLILCTQGGHSDVAA